MIVLTAQIRIQGENPSRFTLGVSILGDGSMFGKEIDEEIVFDRRNTTSLESEIQQKDDASQPSFGIISNGGSLSFRDTNSKFLLYANAGLLTEGLGIKVFLENTITKAKKQVGLYYTTDWDYDNDNRMVRVSFADNLEKLQSPIVSLEDTVSPQNMYEILQWLLSKNLNIDSTCIFTEAAKSSLENTRCEYPVLEEGKSLWNHIDQICKICGLCVYQANNEIVFSTNLNERL